MSWMLQIEFQHEEIGVKVPCYRELRQRLQPETVDRHFQRGTSGGGEK